MPETQTPTSIAMMRVHQIERDEEECRREKNQPQTARDGYDEQRRQNGDRHHRFVKKCGRGERQDKHHLGTAVFIAALEELKKGAEADGKEGARKDVAAKMIPEDEFQRRCDDSEQQSAAASPPGAPNGEEKSEQEERHQRVQQQVGGVPPEMVVRKDCVLDGEPHEEQRPEQAFVPFPVLPGGCVV